MNVQGTWLRRIKLENRIKIVDSLILNSVLDHITSAYICYSQVFLHRKKDDSYAVRYGKDLSHCCQISRRRKPLGKARDLRKDGKKEQNNQTNETKTAFLSVSYSQVESILNFLFLELYNPKSFAFAEAYHWYQFAHHRVRKIMPPPINSYDIIC